MIFDIFSCDPKNSMNDAIIDTRIECDASNGTKEKANNRLIASAFTGTINCFQFEGFQFKEGKPELIKQVLFHLNKISFIVIPISF